MKYPRKSIQSIVQTKVLEVGIKKKVTPHKFRHSFATSLLEDSVDLKIIQKQLVHTSSETPVIYTYVNGKIE